MKGYRVRMLTLHLDCTRMRDPEEAIVDYQHALLEARDKASAEAGVGIDTVRITLDKCSARQALQLVDSLQGRVEEALVSLGNFYINEMDLEEAIARIAEEGFFASILLRGSWAEARKASRILHELADKDPSLATRIGVNVLGERILTPYYPLSSSPVHLAMTTALTYPNYLARAYAKDGLKGMEQAILEAAGTALRALKTASKVVGATPVGVDLSVAPWMEETSLGLVELIAGVRLPEPGIAYGIGLVNRLLSKAASSLDEAVGFNEVQLPVAEDLKLKARVSELETTARDLARLAGVCLAGLDLVVVPADVDKVAGLLLELKGYAMAKGRVLGARIIPVEDVEPGDKVYLDKFGETPVIAI